MYKRDRKDNEESMALKCKFRLCGESLAITIPAQIARMHDIEKGDLDGDISYWIWGIQDKEGGERRKIFLNSFIIN